MKNNSEKRLQDAIAADERAIDLASRFGYTLPNAYKSLGGALKELVEQTRKKKKRGFYEDRLEALRKALARALSRVVKDAGFGVTAEQVDAFIFEPGSNRYLGRLCRFNQCPKGKRDCLAANCGRTPFLKQIEGFRPYADILAPERTVTLFDRHGGILRRAALLPSSSEAAP